MRTAAPSSTRSPTSDCSRSTTGASRSCTKRSSVPGRDCASGSTTTVTICGCASGSRTPPRSGPVRGEILICSIAEHPSRRPWSGATAPMSGSRSSRPRFSTRAVMLARPRNELRPTPSDVAIGYAGLHSRRCRCSPRLLRRRRSWRSPHCRSRKTREPRPRNGLYARSRPKRNRSPRRGRSSHCSSRPRVRPASSRSHPKRKTRRQRARGDGSVGHRSRPRADSRR